MVTRPSTLESDRSELLDLVDRRKPLTPPSPAEQRARQKLVAMLKAKAKHGAECRISDETIAQQRQLVANFASAPSPTQGSAPEPRAQSASERAARRDLARMEEIASRYGERSRFSPEQIERQRELVERLARGWDAPITWLREPVRIPGCTTYVHGYTAGLKLPDWLSILLAEPSGRAA